MATDTSPERPAIALRCGNIKATMWQNVSEKRPSFATTFSRPFKDQSDVWRNGTSFGHSRLNSITRLSKIPWHPLPDGFNACIDAALARHSMSSASYPSYH